MSTLQVDTINSFTPSGLNGQAISFFDSNKELFEKEAANLVSTLSTINIYMR